jgi:hypothetical protein
VRRSRSYFSISRNWTGRQSDGRRHRCCHPGLRLWKVPVNITRWADRRSRDYQRSGCWAIRVVHWDPHEWVGRAAVGWVFVMAHTVTIISLVRVLFAQVGQGWVTCAQFHAADLTSRKWFISYLQIKMNSKALSVLLRMGLILPYGLKGGIKCAHRKRNNPGDGLVRGQWIVR